MREHGIKAKHRTGSRDAHDHLAVLRTSGSQLEVAATNQVKTARFFTLREQGGLCGKRNCAGGQFEVGENGAAKRAKPTGTAMRTGRATHGRLAGAILVFSLDVDRKLSVHHHFAPSAADERPPASCGDPLSGSMSC